MVRRFCLRVCRRCAHSRTRLGHHSYPSELPPPRVSSTWELTADSDRPGEMEFMSCLFGSRTKEDALALAERHIRAFLEERRKQYL